MVKEKMKALTDALTQWQQKESSIHSLAENSAKAAGAPPEHMDAHVYMHKKMIKKAMADHAKQQEEAQGGPGQGVPSAQDMPGGPTSVGVPGPQGDQASGQGGPGVGGSLTAGPGPLAGPPTGPYRVGQGGPGFEYGGKQPAPQFGNFGQGQGRGNAAPDYVYGGSQGAPRVTRAEPQANDGKGAPASMVARHSPTLPQAGEKKNTGANGWEGLLKPSNVPAQAQVQNGQRPESTGPLTPAQAGLPGMPARPVPGGSSTNIPKFGPYTGNTLPTASPPLTRPMR